ncbi:MAG: antitoxin [Verrucomicrobia bacterium]|jgi:hypothetical protein|nr:antitoxin [Verrucomicrobiota bacterium]|tara:strand:- start:59140 stop:59379 length:240 start_codon:yes stop_codon:yes gene_type:complete
MPKLTLHVPGDLVIAAKKEAAARETSVSKMVSDYFRTLEHGDPGGEKGFSPVTSSLIGCIRGAKEDERSYVEYLEEKHS